MDSGKGEKGSVSIIVKKDGAAASGNPTDVEIDLMAIGTPEEYTYSAT